MKRSVSLLALFGTGCSTCGPGMLGELPGETDGSAMSSEDDEASDDGTSADTGADAPPGEWIGLQVTTNKQVDLLFVIDDSRSMGALQANLTGNLPSFVNALEAPDVHAEYRIAITTTDVGAPGCESTAESGAFVASTCLQRISDFFGEDGQDVAQAACLDMCTHATIDIRSSDIEDDDTHVRRPWVERIGAETNINGDVTPLDVLQCFVPQGIDGCEFIAPLEAAKLAIERARTPGAPEYGFLRERAHLEVVIVTDGDDCSVPFEKRAIFLTPDECYDADGDGDDTDDCTQVYWTDPEADAPTPGVCWNAGVECTGAEAQPDGTTAYASCVPADKGLDGAPASADDAVMVPVQAYGDWIAELDVEKGQYGAHAALRAVVGVPIGDTTLSFATSTDPAVNLEQGIGPSCEYTATDPAVAAFPPVRLREVITDVADGPLGEEWLSSACATDFSPVLDGVASSIRAQVKPACATRCAEDLDPSTPALDFECEVRQTVPGPEPEVDVVPTCLADDVVPDGVDVCWVPLTRDGEVLTAMSEECVDDGWNLEARIVRRAGHPALSGTVVEIACEWTDEVDGACPGV